MEFYSNATNGNPELGIDITDTVITVSVIWKTIFGESVAVVGSSSSRVVLTATNTGAQKPGSSLPWLLSFYTVVTNICGSSV